MRPAASCAPDAVPAHTPALPADSNTATNRIVEVAALQLATGAGLGLRVRLPAGESMTPGATDATGITTADARLEHHPEFEQVGGAALACLPASLLARHLQSLCRSKGWVVVWWQRRWA